jgi:hypothetical protein
MIVSNFELLLKRIAPLASGAVARRVVQGYFLQITNLDPIRTGFFYLRIKIPALPAGSVFKAIDREFVLADTPTDKKNVAAIFDIAGEENTERNLSLNSSLTTADYKVIQSEPLKIGPQQTALITLLPNLTGNIKLLKDEKLEVRGMVELLQVPIFFGTLSPEIQVLITPEIRGTFLDNDYGTFPPPPVTNELDFDQINYGLPIASGKAQNTVERAERATLRFPPFSTATIPTLPKISNEVMEQLNAELADMNLVVKRMS